jgi:CheY-like chemotaxis protein
VAKVLIIEDDDVIAQGMARHLTAAGFDAVGVANGETGPGPAPLRAAGRLRARPDAPGIDGWRVIEQARGEGIGTPIVVVSARGTEHDRINALELGAGRLPRQAVLDEGASRRVSRRRPAAARARRNRAAATRSSSRSSARPAQRPGLQSTARAPS